MALRELWYLDRLIDPRTQETIASYGGFTDTFQEHVLTRYWVQIDNHPFEVFRREETAQFFYEQSIQRLRAEIAANGCRENGNGRKRAATNGHKR